jgi:hypothetical protein
MKRNVKKDTSKFISFFSPVATKRAIHDYLLLEEKLPTYGNVSSLNRHLFAETTIYHFFRK